MTAPKVQPANGLSTWILESRLPYFNAQEGAYNEEVWSGLYAAVDAQMQVLIARGAKSVTPSKGGAVCKLTAVFGGYTAPSGGGGGPGEPLTEQWSLEPDVYENDLHTFPEWGPYIGGGADNKTRSDRLIAIDKALRDGTFSSTIDATKKAYNYGLHASFGIKGYLRAPYSLTKTTTWATGEDAEAAINYAAVWSVVKWADIGTPAWVKEPKYVEKNPASSGWNDSIPMQWLRFPPAWGAAKKVFSIRNTWKGAVLWSGTLYKNGGAVVA